MLCRTLTRCNCHETSTQANSIRKASLGQSSSALVGSKRKEIYHIVDFLNLTNYPPGRETRVARAC